MNSKLITVYSTISQPPKIGILGLKYLISFEAREVKHTEMKTRKLSPPQATQASLIHIKTAPPPFTQQATQKMNLTELVIRARKLPMMHL